MATFGLATLGQFAFTHDGRPLPVPTTKKARALLAYLVMHRGADVTREALLDVFWPDFEPERARENLKVTLWSVRRSLRSAQLDPNAVIRADRSVARWIAPIDFDVDRLTELSANGSHNGKPAEAIDVYRGDFLEGDYDEWTVRQRERIAMLYENALSHAASVSKDVAAAEALLERDPYSEAAYAALAQAELAAGRPRRALQWVERCRTALSEVGSSPSAEFERRFADLHVPQAGTGAELRLPFVARDSELRALELRCDRAREGHGSVTIVHGDAGIGKSSLLGRIAQLGRRREVAVIELRATGRETHILGEWQAAYDELTGKPLADVVATAGLDSTRVAATALASSLRGPALIIIDDAHNLSGESFALLGEFVSSASKLCFVIGTRPEGLARLRTLLHERVIPSEMRLDCLSDDDVRSALHQAAGSQLPEVARILFERTKGHPLFVVEMLASLVDANIIKRDERVWRLSAPLVEALPLPATLRSFIEGRLTSRGGVPAMVAGALAIEPASSAAELRAALGMDEAQLLDALDDLLALGLIVQPESASQFAFSHDLVAEVALAMLNAGRQTNLHAAFAAGLRASARRDAPIRRARHLRAASEPLAAAECYVNAARQSRSESAAVQAADQAREGIAVLAQLASSSERDALLGDLQCELALADLTVFDVDRALSAANAAIDFARSARDDARLGEALLARAAVSSAKGLPDDQLVDADEAATLGARIAAPHLRARALVEGAIAARTGANYEAAVSFARDAYAAAKSADLWTVAQRATAEMIFTCATWSNFVEGQRWVLLGNEAALRAGGFARVAHYTACASLWYLLERYPDCEHDLRLAARLAAESDSSGVDLFAPPTTSTLALHRYLTGVLAVALGNWNDALAAVDECAALRASSAFPVQDRALRALAVTALLGRSGPSDAQRAKAVCADWSAPDATQSVFGMSACGALTLASVAARDASSDVSVLMRQALDAVEEHARRTPLEADVAFRRLAEAARESGADDIAVRAAERAAHFRALRRGAAGAAWGGTF